MNLPLANLPGNSTPITLYTPAVVYIAVTENSPVQLYFNLQQFPDQAMYTSIYDLYRIVKVEVEFRPNIKETNITNTSTMGTTYQTALGRIPWYAWVDVTLSSQNADNTTFKSVDNLHTWYYDEVYKFHFWPKPDQSLALSGGSNQIAAGPTSAWIDTAYPLVQHGSLFVQMGDATSGTLPKLATDNSVVNMWVKMWVEFKFNE